MTKEEAARILDPETSRNALWGHNEVDRLDVCNEACRIAANALRAGDAPRSSRYIKAAVAIATANYAADKHPYDKDPEQPETFSDYNRGWEDACLYIQEQLEALAEKKEGDKE